ncbi:hypothetical protein J7J84_08305 [bacterium]|nr:hypothetical protein [bacterium]
MRAAPIAVVLVLMCAALGCQKPDPYRELLKNESFGLGTPLGSPYSQVEERIAESLGQRIADNNVSRDSRYFEFRDVYNNYSFIIGDVNQDNRVDVIIISINSDTNIDFLASKFATEFPNIRTKTGVTLGTSSREVLNYYKFGEHGTRKMLIETHNAHLLFNMKVSAVIGLQLADDLAFKMPLFTLKGRN